MKNTIKVFILTFVIILGVCSIVRSNATAQACEEAPVSFDLSVIEQWCGADGQSIRFVGGEVYERQGNVITLLDEQGNLWTVENVDVDDNDFLLLWIDDNGTDDFTDDVVIKVWREVH